jgi:hypothetical protein
MPHATTPKSTPYAISGSRIALSAHMTVLQKRVHNLLAKPATSPPRRSPPPKNLRRHKLLPLTSLQATVAPKMDLIPAVSYVNPASYQRNEFLRAAVRFAAAESFLPPNLLQCRNMSDSSGHFLKNKLMQASVMWFRSVLSRKAGAKMDRRRVKTTGASQGSHNAETGMIKAVSLP